ncbi:hypothetical protein LTR86_004684 [Recurvomyces mirabilis]|nr:hypothetical protein LTR86_004684 [Recurvomyces mirabilis]
MGAAFALHIAHDQDDPEHRGRTIERQEPDQPTDSHDHVDTSGAPQGVSHSGRGGVQPARPSTRGFWTCCVCHQTNNPALVRDQCICNKHIKCHKCYVYPK